MNIKTCCGHIPDFGVDYSPSDTHPGTVKWEFECKCGNIAYILLRAQYAHSPGMGNYSIKGKYIERLITEWNRVIHKEYLG